MDLILKGDSFDINNISIKEGKNAKKLIYKINNISIIGLSFKIDDFILVNQSNKYLFIDIEKSKQKDILYQINNFFSKKYNKFYKTFIENDILKIRKHKIYTYNSKDDLYITINNMKAKESFIIVQIFTI